MTSPAALVWALGLTLLHSGQGTEEESELSGDSVPEEEETPSQGTTLAAFTTVATDAFTEQSNSTDLVADDNQLEFLLMVLVPLILIVLLLLSVVFLAMYFKRKTTKQEPSSQGSQSALQTYELGSETLKVPIFEEDTPSVMEIEMEELDKWMPTMNRSADYECLPTLKEEKESNHNPSDTES
ncbi:transmembrane protein 154 [Perognathus longimembris pacificus]|uniref:transmembrane protein 154 n=1 Tax=Perognathus longimembris pacificus TaxID=214514 RepID=UPI002019513E|nr:transmembrane protein 154 [Perognathus longimembris pacificus]